MTHKIAFDIRTTHMSGIYRYGTSLLKSMRPLLPGADVKLFVLHQPGMRHLLFDEIGPAKGQMEFVEIADDYGFIRDSAWLRGWLLREEIDLYYSVHYLVDPDLPVPFVYTIHDLIRIKYPDFSYTDRSFIDKFGTEEFGRMRGALQGFTIRVPANITYQVDRGVFYRYFLVINQLLKERSTHVVTVSDTVRRDLVDYLSIPAAKITVISNAVDPDIFYPRPGDSIVQVLQRTQIDGDYCLYVGTGHKHKRLSWLLENLAKYKRYLPAHSKLVLVGSHYDLNPDLRSLIATHGLGESVVFTGRVSDEELAQLYSGAQALVVSSIDEGFCLPVLEALTCKTEVIVPDLPVFHEVAGRYGHFYDVMDGDALMHLTIKALGGTLSSRAEVFKNRFSWNNSAHKLFRHLLGKSRVPRHFGALI